MACESKTKQSIGKKKWGERKGSWKIVDWDNVTGIQDFRCGVLGFEKVRIHFCWVEATWNCYWLNSQSIKPQNMLIFRSNWDKLFSFMEGTSSATYGKFGVDRCCCIWCDRWAKSGNMFPLWQKCFLLKVLLLYGYSCASHSSHLPRFYYRERVCRAWHSEGEVELTGIQLSKEPQTPFYSNFSK